MKVYQTNEIKNISLLGSKGAGKTTLAEAMLYECGVIKRRGTIDAKNTVSDYFPVEKEYGYSVFSTIFYAEFLNKKLNVIDCPGADDFVGNAITALNVTDTGVIVIDAQYGVEVGTQNIFRTTAQLKKPVIFAINQLDGEKADYDNCIEDIPAEEMEKAQEMHQALVEAAAENDETLMEKFFEQGHLTEDEMREGIRKGLVDRSIYPVFCVSALKDMGVRRMMEFLGNVVPFVEDMPAPIDTAGNEVKPDSNGPLSVFMFKTTVEPHIGEVQYFKVMSGTLTTGVDLDNVTRGGKERMAQIFCVCGQIKTPVDKLCAGDIGATVKLKDVRTGNTLDEKGCEIAFDFIKYPAPKYQRAIRPVTESDAEKLAGILTRMHEEDPTWVVEQSKELKQVLLKGQGEFHLRTLKWRVENNDKLPIVFEEPKIPYRETITKAARADYRHKKQSGGAGQFGEVHIIIEPYSEDAPMPDTYRFGNQEYKMSVRDTQEIPLQWGGKLVVHNCIVGGAIDARFIPAIIKGLMDRMEQGPLTGSYARDVRVCIYDGKMHPVDSNEISFRLAARNAFSEAFRAANPKVLEPVYDVEVMVPSDVMGDVMSDLQGRRAIIMGMSSENGFEKISAKVPLKEMSSYSTALSSITGGRSSFTMQFSSYELTPGDVQEKLLKEYAEKNKED